MKGYTQYQSVAIRSATKIQQITLILDEVIKRLYQAKKFAQADKITEDTIAEQYNNLRRAADIFDSMRTGINFEVGGEAIKHFDRFLFSASMEMERINMVINDDVTNDIQKLIDTIGGVRDAILKAAKAEGVE